MEKIGKKFLMIMLIIINIMPYLLPRHSSLTDISMSELVHSPTFSYRSVAQENGRLFAQEPYADLYWKALLLAANNKRKEALNIVSALSRGNPINIKLPPEKTKRQLDPFFDQLFIDYVSCNPQLLTQLGLFESIGIRMHNAYLNDISPKARIQNLHNNKTKLQSLEKYFSKKSLNHQNTNDKVLHAWLKSLTDEEGFLFHEYRINQMTGVLIELSTLFTQYHKLEFPEDVNYYLARLTSIPAHLQQTEAFLTHQAKLGIKYPTFAIEKSINIIKNFLTEKTTDNLFYTNLAQKIVNIKGVNTHKVLAQTEIIIQEKVYPAYKALLRYCENMTTQGGNYGVWALPKGDEYYAFTLRRHTTSNLSADEIHELGLQEVSRIHEEMRVTLASAGINNANKSVGELLKEFAQNPQFYFPETDEGRKQCLARYYAILERSRKELAPFFDNKPKLPVLIEPVPKYEEDGMPGAYYLGPSIDGSRPGKFFANLRSMSEVPMYGMETLLIHEAEPGHHFQIALQTETNMHILRKMPVFLDGYYTAYIEGWALYAEKLAYEQGFYSSAYDRLGHLCDELLRAARLVVDTGIHKKRWTREQAIDYMVNVTGDHQDTVTTEVERYFVLPGQACSYKIGQLKILELRKHAQDALGKKFDIREFHNTVLTLGAAPLGILEEAINQYIKRAKQT